MKKSISNLENTVRDDSFEDLDDLSELFDDKGYVTEVNEYELEEAITDLKRILELLEVAIEEDIIQTLTKSQRSNLRKKLRNTRKYIKWAKSGKKKKNPGEKFLNSVGKLKKSVYSSTVLDLRAGEYLDFSSQIEEMNSIRRDQKKAIETIQETEDIAEEVIDYREKVESVFDTSEQILSDLEEVDSKAKKTDNDINSSLGQVNKHTETINERYEEVLEKTSKIRDFEETLDENIRKTEEQSVELENLNNESKSLQNDVRDIMVGAIGTSLGENFNERKGELERSSKIWALATFGFVGILLLFSWLVFQDLTGSTDFGLATISKATVILPALVGVWFSANNYSRTRKLLEEYAFKATVSHSLEPFQEVLEKQLPGDENADLITEFMVRSMVQIYTNPTDNISDGDQEDGSEDVTSIDSFSNMLNSLSGR